MDTPLHDFLLEYAQNNSTRFHMPGHKGQLTPHDITEILGADALFRANGIIKTSEQNATAIFGSKSTVYSTQGSTSCIFAMILLTCKPGDTIICTRNSHISLYNALTLFNINPYWINTEYNPDTQIYTQVTVDQIKEAINKTPTAKAVYVTSPDYLGIQCDIKEIVSLCSSYNLPLLVDNAHGSHLKFLEIDAHPITLGASLCCDSAHKTLPALTGAAYLHSNYHHSFQLKQALEMVCSTSPSYLILQSLDLLNVYLLQNATSDFKRLKQKVDAVKTTIKKSGFIILDTDQTKISINVVGKAKSLANLMREKEIEPEYVSDNIIVLMLSPKNRQQDFDRLENLFLEKIKLQGKMVNNTLSSSHIQKMTMHDSYFATCEYIAVKKAEGQVCGENISLCPPGMPVVVSGEIIDKYGISLLTDAGINQIKVVK